MGWCNWAACRRWSPAVASSRRRTPRRWPWSRAAGVTDPRGAPPTSSPAGSACCPSTRWTARSTLHLAAAGISARRGIMAWRTASPPLQPPHQHPAPGDRAPHRPDADPAALPPDDRLRARPRVRRTGDGGSVCDEVPVVGASGLAREVMSVVALRHVGMTVNLVDDNSSTWGTLHGLTPVLAGSTWWPTSTTTRPSGAATAAGTWGLGSAPIGRPRDATADPTRACCCPTSIGNGSKSRLTASSSPPTWRSVVTSC